MSVTITDPKYWPSTYAAGNGGGIFFRWKTTLDCSPDPPPLAFSWTLSLVDRNGTVVGTMSGTQAYNGPGTEITVVWPNPSIPEGGVRPRWYIVAACAGETELNICTGITKIKTFRIVTDGGEGDCNKCNC